MHEALQQLRALARVRHLGMELHAVEAPRFIGHAGDRARLGRRHQLEAGRQLGDLVAVAHPYAQHAVAFRRAEILDALEQLRVAVRSNFGIAEFAHAARFDTPAELLRHGLHAVADAQNRHALLEHRLGRLAGRFLVGRQVAAREDDAPGAEITDEGVAYVVRVNLAVDLGFPDPPGDQLRVLRTEVEDQDFLVHYSAR